MEGSVCACPGIDLIVAPPEQRPRVAGHALIAHGYFAEALERIDDALVGAHGETVEAAAAHVFELVAQHVADGAQFATVAEPRAQHEADAEPAAVLEIGQVDGEQRRGHERGRRRTQVAAWLYP